MGVKRKFVVSQNFLFFIPLKLPKKSENESDEDEIMQS